MTEKVVDFTAMTPRLDQRVSVCDLRQTIVSRPLTEKG